MTASDAVELSQRKEAILRAVVEGYIASSHPIGSTAVAVEADLEVSSATIRKELGALEEEGFLQQPHTSAGRIPTEKGYRYFVDTLMQPHQLAGQKSEVVAEFFERTHGELERMLRQTSDLLAGITDYAAVVLPPAPQSATVLSVQFVEISSAVALLVVVLSNGGVERRSIELSEPLTPDEVAVVGAELSRLMVGESEISSKVADTGNATIDALANAALEAWGSPGRDAQRLYVGGAHAVAGGFEAADKIEGVLEVLEKQFVVISLIRDLLDRGLRVSIGTENGMQDLNECSVIVSPYIVEGEEVGSIGVLGPTRMNYPQALAAVAVVSNRLGDLLSDR